MFCRVTPGILLAVQQDQGAGLGIDQKALDVQGGRPRISLFSDTFEESFAQFLQSRSRCRGQASELLWFFFGKDDLLEVPNAVRRRDPPAYVAEQRFVERD